MFLRFKRGAAAGGEILIFFFGQAVRLLAAHLARVRQDGPLVQVQEA